MSEFGWRLNNNICYSPALPCSPATDHHIWSMLCWVYSVVYISAAGSAWKAPRFWLRRCACFPFPWTRLSRAKLKSLRKNVHPWTLIFISKKKDATPTCIHHQSTWMKMNVACCYLGKEKLTNPAGDTTHQINMHVNFALELWFDTGCETCKKFEKLARTVAIHRISFPTNLFFINSKMGTSCFWWSFKIINMFKFCFKHRHLSKLCLNNVSLMSL